MTETNPWFPYFYAASYTSAFNRRTVAQELQLSTFIRTATEVRRDFVALQLFIFEKYGVRLGIGTAWRVQPPAGTPNHADPGNSWHEGIPVSSGVNAMAIDTVACDSNGTPDHDHGWMLQERHAAEFGFISFLYLNDRPHIQSLYIPRSREFRTSTSQLPRWPLPHIPLNPRYDIERIDLNNPLGGAAPVPVPPPTPPPTPPPPTPPPPPGVATVNLTLPVLRLGVPDQPAVGLLQTKLNELAGQGLRVDNNFGPATQTAVMNWQSFFNVAGGADGVVGSITWQSVYGIESLHNFAA
jgi:Putative peptidoglycan binding domain